MLSEWRNFLLAAGANSHKDRINASLRTQLHSEVINTDILCDLSELGLISASGKESADFLQSQLINDVYQVTPTHSQLNAYCNPKGRMLAIFRLFKRDDELYLRLPQEVLTPTLQRLRMYVLRTEVTLEDASEKLVRIGLAGPSAQALLTSVVDNNPSHVDDCVSQNGITILRVPSLHPRYELYGEVAEMRSVWSALSRKACPVDGSVWSLLDIFAGIPTVLEQTVERFVPQMANLDLIGGVSFDKGCYPGQEIIARTRYLGTLKRRMFRCHANTEDVPRPGTVVYSHMRRQDPNAGTIVDAQPNPNGGTEVLAVLRLADVETAELRLDGPGHSSIDLKTLPYKVVSSD